MRAGAVLLEGRSRTGSGKYVTRTAAAVGVRSPLSSSSCPPRGWQRCAGGPYDNTYAYAHDRWRGTHAIRRARARTPSVVVTASFPGAPRSDRRSRRRRRDDVTTHYDCGCSSRSLCVPRLRLVSVCEYVYACVCRVSR